DRDVGELFRRGPVRVRPVLRHAERVEGVDPVYKLHCPMAFNNRGADWLQPKKAVRNPYYGSKMLTCGEVVEVLHGD
ncbi:MAG: hypothetical protein R6V58_04560, partial [Planctomycetota bacterium]